MSKAEKRKAALAEKVEREAAKRAVSLERIVGAEKVVAVAEAKKATLKRPTSAEVQEQGLYRQLFAASWGSVDREGTWSWGVHRDYHKTGHQVRVESFVADYHQIKTWLEVVSETRTGKEEQIKKKHITYSVGDLPREVRSRLADLEKDDNDEIFRFRMSNLERLYGFIRAADFEVIWFDPTHQIYPTDP